MSKPTGGNKSLGLENKETGLKDIGQMDAEVMGRICVISPKGQEGRSPGF